MPYVAPSNLITLIESFPAYWRPFLKGSWYMRVGDPENAADRADLEKRSPLNYVDRIQVPLLVVHGANDPRVKQAESDRIVMALRDKGAAVEYIVAPDEGHGFRAPNNNMALAAAMEKFFAKHLGGRYQESMTESTAKRLAEITVDPASVKAPAAGAAAAAAATGAQSAALPSVNGDALAAGSFTYAAAFAMGPQKIEMDVVRTLAEAKNGTRACWRVTDVSSGAMGSSTETFDLDRKTLAPVAHEAAGMGTIKVNYAPDAITGELSGGGQTIPVKVALDAPVLADGTGFEVTLAALPLATGYKTIFRVFEPLQQKVRPMQLEVTGEDNLTVAAGSFPVYVVAVTPLDGETGGTATLHVMKNAPHHVVKSTHQDAGHDGRRRDDGRTESGRRGEVGCPRQPIAGCNGAGGEQYPPARRFAASVRGDCRRLLRRGAWAGIAAPPCAASPARKHRPGTGAWARSRPARRTRAPPGARARSLPAP